MPSTTTLWRSWTTVPGLLPGTTVRLHGLSGTSQGADLPPIVFVHGFGVSARYFVPVLSRAGEHARVYAPDLPGHGMSQHDARPRTITELALALGAWMDAHELRAAVLVGHSLGCQIAAELALRRSDLAAGLILIGPTSDPRARTVPRQGSRLLATMVFERPALGAIVARDYLRAGPRVLTRELRDMLQHRLEFVLPRISVPVFIMRGSHDSVAPQAWAAELARATATPSPAPGVLPGAGHAAHYTQPALVADAVVAFARALQPVPLG